MDIVNFVRVVLCAVLLGMAGPVSALADDNAAASETERQIAAMEKELEQANAARDADAVAALYWDDLVDIHGSGWIYSKDESVELLRNRLKQSSTRKVIKSDKLEWQIVALDKNAGYATGINETYYEVPNPQTLAKQAGVLTRSKEASAAADQRPASVVGDSMASPNPYRIRTVRVWVRKNGEWKIAVSQSTRIGERVQPGR